MTSSAGAKTPPTLRWLRVRLLAVASVLTALLAAIGYKAWTVQIVDGARMKRLGEAQYLHELQLPAPRGSILDTNGVELAVSVQTDSIWVNGRELGDPGRTARALASALTMDAAALEEKLAAAAEARRRFVWIKRRVPPDEARRVRELGLPGVALVDESRRFYPGRELAGPILGFAGLDGRGLEGIELSLDERLRGTETAMAVLRDGRGNVLMTVDPDAESTPATAGATVTLTIDRFIQYTAEQALLEAIVEHQAVSGTVVVLDPRTGDVLAMASFPTYDPNDPSERAEARNRAVTDTFEPGSTMKVFTIAAALEAGAVLTNDLIDIEGGRLKIGPKTIRDTHVESNVISISQIMQFSSNVGAAKIARKLGRDPFREALISFGFGAKTGVELPGERAGRVRETKVWGEIGLATLSFGYGLTVTPLQLVTGVAAIANGGTLWTPRIVRRVTAADGRVLVDRLPAGRRVVRPETARDVDAMLRLVMQKGGTGEKIKVPGFLLAGKTGTAHKVDPTTRRYSADRYLSSFVGYAPADDPRLVILVMIDEPRGKHHYGGVVAGPTFARIAGESLRYLGIEGTAPIEAPSAAKKMPVAAVERPADEDEALAIEAEAQLIEEMPDVPPAGPGEDIVVIPDFSGMSIGQAIAASRASGVKLEIEGSGRAVRQFPQPGRAMKSIACRVTFSDR